LSKESSQPDEAFMQQKEEIARLRTEKDELAGKGKQLYADNIQLKEELKSIAKERDQSQKRLAEFEAQEMQRKKEHEYALESAKNMKQAWEDERIRIRREDEERQAREIAERDRMWNEHEQNVIALIGELCKLPEYAFSFFENTSLPEKFDGSLKPDAMIDFLGQYLIFDAKVSRSDNLQSYLQNQVKTTVNKVKKNPQIYRTIYFVVPTEALATLKKTYFFEGGYAFFVISPDAIPPILGALKKITAYELAQEMDPQERENIVTMIAEFDFHIHFRNAADLILAQSGVGILDKMKQLNPQLQDDVALKKSKMRQPNLQNNDVKHLMLDTKHQQETIDSLVSPQVPVPEKHLGAAARMLSKKAQ